MKLMLMLVLNLFFIFNAQSACYFDFSQAPGNCNFSDGNFPPIIAGCKQYTGGGNSIEVTD